MLKESNKSRFHSHSVRNSVLIISHIAFRDCREHNFSDSRNSCIFITPYMSLMQQLYITGALKGHHLKGVYLPQDLYFPLTTLLAHPRWDLPVKCFTPMVSENKSTLNKRMKSSLLGYYSSRYLLFILYLTICFWICCIKSWASIWEKWHHCQRAKTWRIISITAKNIRRMLITRLICIQWKFTTLDQLASPWKFGSLRFFSTTEAFTCSKVINAFKW